MRGSEPVRGDQPMTKRLLRKAYPMMSLTELRLWARELSLNPPGHLSFSDCYDIAEAVTNGYRDRQVAGWYKISDQYVQVICRALGVRVVGLFGPFK